jgi:hypothetical protein
MAGFKKFHVEDFPFDRQVINLQQLDFVWRSNKDDDDYYNTMKVVWLRVFTCSMLSEWSTHAALVTPTLPSRDADGEDAASSNEEVVYSPRFQIEILIERMHEFYVRQIFYVSFFITISACSPLGTPPTDMGDRLSVYGGGLLALVAFKYGIMEHLPSVPYTTYTDYFLFFQIITVTVCTFESLIVYRFREYDLIVDMIENNLLVVVIILWSIILLHATYRKPYMRTSWDQVREEAATEIRLVEQVLPDFLSFHVPEEVPDDVVERRSSRTASLRRISGNRAY